MADKSIFSPANVSAVIEMALSDHVSFGMIEAECGLNESAVKALMCDSLKRTNYRSWRKRVRRFAARREHYK
jgi:uncharacterized protein (TIGR03643 family)